MYNTPQPIPAPPADPGPKRPDREELRFRLELILAIGLAIAIAAGLLVAGGSGRLVEVLVLAAAVAVALVAGWPVAAHAALGAAAAYLVLETVFGRLDADHLGGTLVLTAGILGAVVAAGFAHQPKSFVDTPPGDDDWGGDPWAHEVVGRGRLTAGTLEYEIERARRHERPLSLLAIVPDELDVLAAGAGESLPTLLDLIDAAIEAAVRAIDIVERVGRARFRVALPETGPEAARIVAERIRLRIDATRPELEPGRVVGVSVSIGISTHPADGTDDVELEAAAERALAHAQELGGNRTMLFSLPPGAPKGWAIGIR
jgi:diguanylate cyclase (GGDEF)-like protein